MKPFTTIGGMVLLLIAAVQAIRAFLGIEVVINGYHVPVLTSWVVAAVLGALALMVLREARR